MFVAFCSGYITSLHSSLIILIQLQNTINDGLQKPALDGTATHFNLPFSDVNRSPFSPPVQSLMVCIFSSFHHANLVFSCVPEW